MEKLAIDESWKKFSKCRNEKIDTDLFFDGFEKLDQSQRAIFLAKTCYKCASLEPCLESATQRREESGLFGGKYFVNGNPKNPLRILHNEPKRDQKFSTSKVEVSVGAAS